MANQEVQLQASNRDPEKEKGNRSRAAVIGFAREDCRKCFGRGRIGFDVKYHDNLHVIICTCVEMMDLDTVQKSWERDHAEKTSDEAASQENASADAPASESDQGPSEAVGAEIDVKG